MGCDNGAAPAQWGENANCMVGMYVGWHSFCFLVVGVGVGAGWGWGWGWRGRHLAAGSQSNSFLTAGDPRLLVFDLVLIDVPAGGQQLVPLHAWSQIHDHVDTAC